MKTFITEQLSRKHVVISHPITKTDSKQLAVKMIENGNIKSKSSKQ